MSVYRYMNYFEVARTLWVTACLASAGMRKDCCASLSEPASYFKLSIFTARSIYNYILDKDTLISSHYLNQPREYILLPIFVQLLETYLQLTNNSLEFPAEMNAKDSKATKTFISFSIIMIMGVNYLLIKTYFLVVPCTVLCYELKKLCMHMICNRVHFHFCIM